MDGFDKLPKLDNRSSGLCVHQHSWELDDLMVSRVLYATVGFEIEDTVHGLGTRHGCRLRLHSTE